MPRAVILGGTGAIGRSTARRVLDAGWRVDLTGRDPSRMPTDLAQAGAGFTALDRADATGLRALLGSGTDLLLDCACFTADEARQRVALLDDVGAMVMVSSKAVYVDAAGHHANSDVPPRFDGPIRETQATVPPGTDDPMSRYGYGTSKVAAERVLLDSDHAVTVLRPGKVHGAGARQPREWVFLKRVLDRRPAVLLARRGRSVDHTTAADNVAALVATVANLPGRRVLNVGDPDAPDVRQIARTVARFMGHEWDEVLLEDDADPALGSSPWDAPYSVVLDTSAAVELGYVPAGDYASTVAGELAWLLDCARGGGDAGLLPGPDDSTFSQFLDFAAEDRYLAARGV